MKKFLIFAMLAGFCNASFAQEDTPTDLAAQLEGVYKNRHEIGFPGNTPSEMVEDTLEIVRLSDTTIYIHVKLLAYNGHGCGFYGVGEEKADDLFIYKPSKTFHRNLEELESSEEDQCRIEIHYENGVISLNDHGKCARNYCSVRGSIGEVLFNKSKKRKIRYMQRLLNSTQYKEALLEYKNKNSTE